MKQVNFESSRPTCQLLAHSRRHDKQTTPRKEIIMLNETGQHRQAMTGWGSSRYYCENFARLLPEARQAGTALGSEAVAPNRVCQSWRRGHIKKNSCLHWNRKWKWDHDGNRTPTRNLWNTGCEIMYDAHLIGKIGDECCRKEFSHNWNAISETSYSELTFN